MASTLLAGCGNGKSDDEWVRFQEVYWDDRKDGLARKPLDPAHVPNLVFTLEKFEIPHRLIGKSVLLVQYRDFKDTEIMWNVTLRSQEKEWLEAAKRNFEIPLPMHRAPGRNAAQTSAQAVSYSKRSPDEMQWNPGDLLGTISRIPLCCIRATRNIESAFALPFLWAPCRLRGTELQRAATGGQAAIWEMAKRSHWQLLEARPKSSLDTSEPSRF